MSAITTGTKWVHATARSAGAGMLALLLALTACTPSSPQSGGTSQPAVSPAAPASAASSAPATPTEAPSASATVPADTDETAPPQSGDKVISSTIVHDWAWPGPGRPFTITHNDPLTPGSKSLIAIGAGQHASETPAYDQLSFRFEGNFPSYTIEFVPELIQDASGFTLPMPGTGAILQVVFQGTDAHTPDGSASTIKSQPPETIGYKALTSYLPAGDYEGFVTYGIGVGRPVEPVPETRVRVYEVEKIEQGQHLYVVAIQLDTTFWQ